MPKNIDDISLPERRKSIRNIPIPEGRRKIDNKLPPVTPVDSLKRSVPINARVSSPKPEVSPASPTFSTVPTPPRPPAPPRDEYIEVHPHGNISSAPLPPRRRSKKGMWYAVGAAMVIILFAALTFFDGGNLSYVPRSAALTFENETYKAVKSGGAGLTYSVVKLSREKGLAATAAGEEQVSRKASGSIIVYNKDSAEPQKLIENTRFESPSGKIYRIQKAITIPGKKTVNGTSQPGSIEVTVYADEAGEAYNSPLTDFTVPGLKGTPRFETIYARSKTPMSGGFVGKEMVVKADDLLKTKVALQEALKKDLWDEAQAEVPEDFILFPTLASYTFEDMPQTPGTVANSTQVNLRGSLNAVMFKRSDLAKQLSQNKLKLMQSDVVDLLSYDSIKLSMASSTPTDLLNANEISLKASGTGTIVWRTDEVALRADLAGRHKKDIPTILENYPTISSASATVRPFWKTVMPSSGEKIIIKKLPVE